MEGKSEVKYSLRVFHIDPQETSLHRRKLRASFDHLVGSGKQRERDL
jgi:hypothetical protein